MRIALDLHDLLVFDVDALAAPDRAIGADTAHHPVGGGGSRRDGTGLFGGDRRSAAEHVAGAQLPDYRPLQEFSLNHALQRSPVTPPGAVFARQPDTGRTRPAMMER